MTTRFTRSAFALSGIFALSLSMASPMAFAQEVGEEVSGPGAVPPVSSEGEESAPGAAAAQAHYIDPDADGSIVIHKFLFDNPVDRGTGNSTDKAPEGATALGNVPFSVQKVKLSQPLNTAAGFAEAAKLTPSSATVDPESPAVTKSTLDNGVATFDKLAVGVYLVKELPVAGNEVKGLEKGKELAAAAPFLVFIPMTNPADRTSWNYNVNVFPKNSQTGAEKKVIDKGAQVGQQLYWDIFGDVPVPAENHQLSEFVVTDEVDATKVSQPKVTVSTVDNTVALVASDYEVVINEAPEPVTAGSKHKVEVKFTDAGLKKLTDAKLAAVKTPGTADPRVKVEISATVRALGENGASLLENEAVVVTNNGSSKVGTTVKTNKVQSYFGRVKVNKVDESNKPLPKAKFQVFECTGSKDKPAVVGDAIEAGGKSEWETDASGSFTVDALHVTDFENNAETTEAKHYCLVETEAPAGYELLTKPVQFDLTRADLGYTGLPEAKIVNLKELATITNVKSTTPNLPLTGGPGIIALVLGGLALIGGGAWYGLRSTRKA